MRAGCCAVAAGGGGGGTGSTRGRGGGDAMTDRHIANFVAAIRTGEALRSPIAEGRKSVLLCHLGNLAQEHGGALRTDPSNGHILDNPEAAARWQRTYAPGWEPTLT